MTAKTIDKRSAAALRVHSLLAVGLVLAVILLHSNAPAVGADLQKVILCDSRAAGAIAIPAGASPILRRAAVLLQSEAERLGGRRCRIVEGDPAGCTVVLSTRVPDGTSPSPAQGEALAEEAYLARVVQGGQAPQVALVGGSDRAVLYAAARLADLALQTEENRLVLEVDQKVHRPALSLRGNYTLACWGKTHLFTRDHWLHVLDRMADDSMNVTLFWLAGLFPSRQHPEAVVYRATKIGVEDVRALIRRAHDRGMRFLIGSGVFAWFGIDQMADKHPESKAVGSDGMCPSSPLAQRLNLEYLLEMLETFPEADGFYLEIRDEYGPCRCPACQRQLDQGGSKQYGRSEIEFFRRLTEQVWRRNPKAILVTAVGYGDESQGAHSGDVLFYQSLRAMSDPRLFWLVCRNHWQWPGPDGPKPIRWFSPNLLQWCQYYRLSTGDIGGWIRRSRDAGCIGFCPAFEPGFCSASWYSDEVPYPVDALPYAVTRFAYREYCWDPDMSDAEFRARLLRRFFGPSAPKQLADDLLLLFDTIRAESQNSALSTHGKWCRGDARNLLEQTEKALAAAETSAARQPLLRRQIDELCRVLQRRGDVLAQMRRHWADALPQLPPRGKATAALFERALADTEAELCLDPASAARVRRVAERAEKIVAERMRNLPATAAATSQYNDTTYAALRALDGDSTTSWLCTDRARLPQVLTITLRQKRSIDYVKLAQGTYHPAYNTRAYRIEYSADGKQFSPLAAGELANRVGATQEKRFAAVEAIAVRVLIDSVYPNIDYSSPSLSEVDVGLGKRSWLSGEGRR